MLQVSTISRVILYSMLLPRTIAINTISSIVLHFSFWSLPLQHNKPCISFQQHSNGSQGNDNSNIRIFPLFFGVQDVKSFKYVDDAKDYDCVSNWVVIDIPVQSEFVILLGPQKQSKHLLKFKRFPWVKHK